MRCLAVLAIALTGCTATVAPRFPDDVAAAVAEHDMRRLETARLIVYYPAARHDLALRAVERMTTCQAAIEKQTALRGWAAAAKPVVVMPELPMNNAYMIPRLNGYEDVALVATHHTIDFATPFGLPPDPGAVGCHEIVHAVQEAQIGGIYGVIDRVFGDILSPQTGLDAWFWEGLATYYEGVLQPGMGRLAWPAWRGVFAAAYAGGDLDGDDLSELKRLAPMGHHYLVGSHFIEWLATKYGEDQLWQVIGAQGTSTALAFDINGRFKRVYGVSLSTMIDRFAAHLRRDLPRRDVPAGQTRVREIGTDARYARAADGTEAVVAEGLDVAPFLEVRSPDGTVVFSQNLIDVIPPRQLVTAAPLLVSGMSFTRNARWLYLTVVDLGETYQIPRLLRLDILNGELDEIAHGLGPGGAVSPDGTVYWTMHVDGDAWGLDEVDLATNRARPVIAPVPGQYILKVAPSPSGERLALTRWDGAQFAVSIVDRAGASIAEIAFGAGLPVYDASFVDDERVIYLASVQKRFQVFVEDVTTGARQQITDAPYTALEPRAAGGTVRFLDREAWRWELAEVALPDPVTAAAAPVEEGPVAAPGTIPTTEPLRVISDRGYSMFDGLFVPQLRGLAFTSPSLGAALFGGVLAGGDRLGLQRWALTGYANVSPKPVLWSWAAGYRNSMLAPWWLTIEAQDLRWHHPVDSDPDTPQINDEYEDRAQLDVAASFGRVVRGSTLISFDGVYTRDDFSASSGGTEPPVLRRMGGAGVTLALDTAETTPYGGARRRLGIATRGVYYPSRLNTFDTDLIDLRGELALTIPTPVLRRHRFDVSLIGRGLVPREDGASIPPLIEVGGTGGRIPLYQHVEPDEDPPLVDDELLPAHLRFEEPLRGFEDWFMPARRAALANVRWRYPVILDFGWATSLYYLPAILVRELDFELFGSAAVIDDGGGGVPSQHFAVGAAALLSLSLWRVPVVVEYQISQRLSDDDALGHLFAVGLPL